MSFQIFVGLHPILVGLLDKIQLPTSLPVVADLWKCILSALI